jgi:hypothetical protein
MSVVYIVIRRLFSLKDPGAPYILHGIPMTPTLLITALCVALAVIAYYAVRRSTRQSGASRDLGVVSTRWIAELRRDEPWTRS